MLLRFLVPALCAAGCGMLAAGPAGAVAVGQVDDFQDGTTQDWRIGITLETEPDNVTGGPGGAGDLALRIRTNGEISGPGSKLIALNTAQWAGDYAAAGVTGLTVDLSNPNNVPLHVRIALQGAGGAFYTDDTVVPAGTGVWNNYAFDLGAAGLSGGFDLAATLADAFELRILHNPDPEFIGAPVSADGTPFAATLLIDNLTAVGAAALLGDYNDSGLVEQGDLDQVLSNWGAGFASIPSAWINQRPTEGIVDQAELDAVLSNWGAGAATPDLGGASVPEPSAGLLIASVALAMRRRLGRYNGTLVAG